MHTVDAQNKLMLFSCPSPRLGQITRSNNYATFFSRVRGFVFVCVAMDTAEGGMVDLEATAKRRNVTIQFGELIISSDFDSGT